VPPAAPSGFKLMSYKQAIYKATAADGQPVFYILALEPGSASQPVLRFEIQFPTPDAAAVKRAQQAVRDMI